MTPIFLYLLALFTLSQSAAFAKWADAPPEIIGFWRLLAAGLLVLPWAYLKADFKKQWLEHAGTRKWIYLTGFFFFCHLWTFFYASQHTLISHTMIIFATNPLFVALGQWILTKERPSGKTFGAYTLAMISLIILFQQSYTGFDSQIWGDLSALFSSMFFSIYILLSKRCRENFHNSVFTSSMYLVTAGFFGLMILFSNKSWIDYPSNTWMAIAGQTVFSTLLGHSLIAYLMKHLNITLLSTGKLAEPVMAAVVASFIFDEKITTRILLSFVLTASALFLLLKPTQKRT